MNSLKIIQFVTSNFTQLKGLHNAIIGVLLIGTTLWSDKNQGDLSLPIVMSVLAIILWIMAEKHYQMKFGKVKRKTKTQKLEILISIMFTMIGLGAFILDSAEILPVSSLGIVFALATFADYLRMNLKWRESFFSFLPWFSVILFAVSLLPLLGLEGIWRQFGFNSPITGVMTLVGLLVLINGLLSHFYLLRSLPATQVEG